MTGTAVTHPDGRSRPGPWSGRRLPTQLRDLAGVSGEVKLEVIGAVTLGSVLDSLEAAFPHAQGDHQGPGQR